MKKQPKIAIGNLVKLRKITKLHLDGVNKIILRKTASEPLTIENLNSGDFFLYSEADLPLLYIGHEVISSSRLNTSGSYIAYKFLLNNTVYHTAMKFTDTFDIHFNNAFEVIE